MRTSGVFSIHRFDVPLRGGKAFRIIPFGDVHFDSDQHVGRKFRAWVKYAAAQKNAVFLGMGDYLESYSTSERSVIADGGLHETSRRDIERIGRAKVRGLADLLAPLKGRIIGLLNGNHFPAFPDGTNGDQELARLLGCRYLGACAAIRMHVRSTGGSAFALDIFAHHGRGAARTIGGSLAGVQKLMDCCVADIYLMGDDHKLGATPVGERLQLYSATKTENRLALTVKRPWVGRTGSWATGYADGVASYVVDGALPPTALGWIEFSVRVVRSSKDTRELVITGSTHPADSLE